jgi:hypothetical protein
MKKPATKRGRFKNSISEIVMAGLGPAIYE